MKQAFRTVWPFLIGALVFAVASRTSVDHGAAWAFACGVEVGAAVSTAVLLIAGEMGRKHARAAVDAETRRAFDMAREVPLYAKERCSRCLASGAIKALCTLPDCPARPVGSRWLTDAGPVCLCGLAACDLHPKGNRRA